MREERDALFDKLQVAESEADDAYLVTAARVLELAKNAKRLWDGRTPAEQRDFRDGVPDGPRVVGNELLPPIPLHLVA